MASAVERILSVDDILSQLYFIYVTSGIIMSVVVALGIVGNSITLAVLCRKSLRSSPVCLLQCLTIHALINMFYSVYSDIEPAIRSYKEAKKLIDSFGQPNINNLDLELYTNSSLLQILDLLTNTKRNYDISNSSSVAVFNGSDGGYGNDITTLASFDRVNDKHSKLLNFNNISQIPFLLPDPATYNASSQEIDSYLKKSVERFFAYSIVYFGLLVTLYLAIERCVAVCWPFKASVFLTIRRTRLAIICIAFFCAIVHLPQLIQDMIDVAENPSHLEIEPEDFLIESRQKAYYRFYAISSLVFCLVLFVLNLILLRKLTTMYKQCRMEFQHSKLSSRGKSREINVTVLIVVLIFFQLPLYVFMNVIVFISQENFIKRFNIMTKITTVIRLLYITQSSFNFVIYCLFARKFRKELKETCDSVASSNALNIYVNRPSTNKRKSHPLHACAKAYSVNGVGSGSGISDLVESEDSNAPNFDGNDGDKMIPNYSTFQECHDESIV